MDTSKQTGCLQYLHKLSSSHSGCTLCLSVAPICDPYLTESQPHATRRYSHGECRSSHPVRHHPLTRGGRASDRPVSGRVCGSWFRRKQLCCGFWSSSDTRRFQPVSWEPVL